MDQKSTSIVVLIAISIFILLVVQAVGVLTLASHNENLVIERTWDELKDYAVIISTQIDGDVLEI
ncbi:hypothetical protein [Methanolacinia petrolearia]|uniref:hypothetical protein n=1 Tax=Methanolacinia petrolearia TaxID=54120 RepID=UPI003BA92339